MVVVVLEAARRSIGPALSIMGALFFLYPLFADRAPGFLERKAVTLSRIASAQYLYPTGIFGSTMHMAATLIVAFIIFGAFLNASGAGKAFIDLALSLAGRYRGGPAKVAVLGSTLFGMVNGSTLANVATVGTVTIPLMKQIGYKPVFAGAVEAVASSAGPITPPVLGAAIFIMMDFLGESYVKMMLISIVPAFLFFLGLFIMVDHEAVKNNLKGMPPDQVPPLTRSLKKSWLCVLPLAAIVYLLVILHFSPATAAMGATAVVLVATAFNRETRMGPRKIAEALAASSSGLPQVVNAIAVSGILMGAFYVTGLGLTISQELVAVSAGNLFVLVVIVFIACLVFGTGLSGVAVYLMAAIFLAPALVSLGVKPIAAHFFVLWIAHAALITPPAAPAAFLAAAIAGAPLMATGWQACRLGVVVYVMSTVWVVDPAVLLIGSPWHIATAIAGSIVGVYFMSSAVSGRAFGPVGWPERVLFFGGGILLMFPGAVTQLTGLGTVALTVVWQVFRAKLAPARV